MRKRWLLILISSLAVAGCANMHSSSSKDQDEEKDEVQVKFDDCPALVKATLEKETSNATIETVDKEMKDGKAIYEADATLNGQNWEIKVAEDGTLLSKKVDNEEDEKKGQAEEHEIKEKEDKD